MCNACSKIAGLNTKAIKALDYTAPLAVTAGFVAAGYAKEALQKVTIVEKNPIIGTVGVAALGIFLMTGKNKMGQNAGVGMVANSVISLASNAGIKIPTLKASGPLYLSNGSPINGLSQKLNQTPNIIID